MSDVILVEGIEAISFGSLSEIPGPDAVALPKFGARHFRLRGRLTYVSPEFTAILEGYRALFGLPPSHYNPLPCFGLRPRQFSAL